MSKMKFDWDEGNKYKSVNKHGISNAEAESIFYDLKKNIYEDVKHSQQENRYICVGNSCFDRLIYSVFTLRNQKIRIISSRLANKKNVEQYGNK